MTNLFATADTLPEAYHDALVLLAQNYDTVPCPAWNTECREVCMTMTVKHPLQEPTISKVGIFSPRDLQKYLLEMTDGIMDWAVEAGKWEYTYHERIAWQLPRVIELLLDDPHSRRAFVPVVCNRDAYRDDPPCLQHIQFFIRDGKLDMSVLFRSNDAIEATFMNAFALIMIQKSVADALRVPVGTYTHRANSFHVYAKNYDMLDSAVERILNGDELAYDYVGDWKEQMEEYRDEIIAEAEELRERNGTNV